MCNTAYFTQLTPVWSGYLTVEGWERLSSDEEMVTTFTKRGP